VSARYFVPHGLRGPFRFVREHPLLGVPLVLLRLGRRSGVGERAPGTS
jgi:hypothetical protein